MKIYIFKNLILNKIKYELFQAQKVIDILQ